MDEGAPRLLLRVEVVEKHVRIGTSLTGLTHDSRHELFTQLVLEVATEAKNAAVGELGFTRAPG